jgi:hypothetical protein
MENNRKLLEKKNVYPYSSISTLIAMVLQSCCKSLLRYDFALFIISI